MITRKEVSVILNALGIVNKFSLNSVGFDGAERQVVTVKEWSPNPIAETIKSELKQKLGVLVCFDGKGFVQ